MKLKSNGAKERSIKIIRSWLENAGVSLFEKKTTDWPESSDAWAPSCGVVAPVEKVVEDRDDSEARAFRKQQDWPLMPGPLTRKSPNLSRSVV